MEITRKSGQQAVVNAYLHWSFLLVEYCTGFGKGKAALDAVMTRLKEQDTYVAGMIVVHSIPAKKHTWPNELNKWAPDIKNYSTIDIQCYPSLKNISGRMYDWCIVDECHYLTLNNEGFFKKNIFKSIILMTGLLPDDPDKIRIIKRLSNGRKLTIKLDTAIANNILNNYQIVVWNIKLTNEEWNEYLHLCKRVDSMSALDIHALTQQVRGERAQFIYNLESKYKAGCYVRDQIRKANRRMVIFTASKQIADRLSPYRYYEGTGDKDFLAFCKKEINELVSIKMIQEGANIDDLDSALMQQLNSKALNFMQKLGRFMRLHKDGLARIHILNAFQTYDDSWVRKSLSEADKSKIIYKDLPAELYQYYK